MIEKEDRDDVDEMQQTLDQLHRDRIDDLAHTASLIGSWMSDQKYTIAEQLATVELLRSSILVNFIQTAQMSGMAEFMKDNPNAKIVVVDGRKDTKRDEPRTFDPNRS